MLKSIISWRHGKNTANILNNEKNFLLRCKGKFFCLSLSCLRILADGDVMKQLNEQLESYLAFGSSFDLVCRRLLVQDRQYSFYFVDGFVKDEIMERIMSFLLKRDFDPDASLEKQLQTLIPYVEAEVCRDVHKAALAVLSGVSVLYPQDADGFLCIDVRTYPTRSMSEPEDDRVLRGARDGFVETLIFNTALIRRRIRDPRLRMEHFAIGDMRDDVVLCTIEGVCSAKLHEELACRLRGLDVHALTMGQESLAEALLQRHWWQLFPMVRYSERPDVACAHLQEGGAVIIVDNSPSVLLLPLSLFDFVQEAQDYYFPPLVGTYLRFVRILVFVMAQFLTPLWFWFSLNPQLMPSFFRFALIQGESNLGIFWQLMVLELGIDAIKLASLNTPSSLSGSFSIVGALILGDYAVSAGWFDPEILLYMAFVALANFTQPSYELGYAIKLYRMFMLICIALLPFYGLWIALALLLFVLFSGRSRINEKYLYPLYPFDLRALSRVLFRHSIRNTAPGSGHKEKNCR